MASSEVFQETSFILFRNNNPIKQITQFIYNFNNFIDFCCRYRNFSSQKQKQNVNNLQ